MRKPLLLYGGVIIIHYVLINILSFYVYIVTYSQDDTDKDT